MTVFAMLKLILVHFVFTRVVVTGELFMRHHLDSEDRNIQFATAKDDLTADTVTVENYLRNYRHDSRRGYFLYTHDLIAGYVGPAPKNHPNPELGIKTGTIRTWAMFDSTTMATCNLNVIFNWGELALFTCPKPGNYRVYALDVPVANITDYVPTTLSEMKKPVLVWDEYNEIQIFDLLLGQMEIQAFSEKEPSEKMQLLPAWVYTTTPPSVTLTNFPVVSGQIQIKGSHNCYYWLYTIQEVAKFGYVGKEVHLGGGNETKESWESYKILDLYTWIAEPAAIGMWETFEAASLVTVSQYSRVITRRFAESGAHPCLRDAHGAIEVIRESEYISDDDNTNTMKGTPHFRIRIKVHTDRLISTLSTVAFSISTKHNTGVYTCFIGDTRVIFQIRNFEFVPHGKLSTGHIKLDVSKISRLSVLMKFDRDVVYGHNVHFIGYIMEAMYEPASTRSDAIVVTNPCDGQEFAFSAAGSLYITSNYLRRGIQEATKVLLPLLPWHDFHPHKEEFLQILDVAFTPTHAVFLLESGTLFLHPSSAKYRGIGTLTATKKFHPYAIAKRRWCPRTVTPKLSAMILPIRGMNGDIIIVQIYPTEGNVQMWIRPESRSCRPAGVGLVKKNDRRESGSRDELENEIHKYEAVLANSSRTDLITGRRTKHDATPYKKEVNDALHSRNLYEEKTYILDSSTQHVEEGTDPHFLPHITDPASQPLERNLTDYNDATIYVIEKNRGLNRLLRENSLVITAGTDTHLNALEFTAEEKQYIYMLSFKSDGLINISTDPKFFSAIVGSFSVSNFPYYVEPSIGDGEQNYEKYEKLHNVAPFPGVILVRLVAFHVEHSRSRELYEEGRLLHALQGRSMIEFVPQLFVLGTAIPSYVVHLGNVLMISSIENRYARPLHYFPWSHIHKVLLDDVSNTDQDKAQPTLLFEDSLILLDTEQKNIPEAGSLSDVVVTKQGLISVMRRRKHRHWVQDDAQCFPSKDSPVQNTIMGSVLTPEGLRELRPFFRNDNVFQQATPDGEIIYGVYNVKPRSMFRDCQENTKYDVKDDPCVEQSKKPDAIRACTKETPVYGSPCQDVAFLEYCTYPLNPLHTCLRENRGCFGGPSNLSRTRDAFDNISDTLPGHQDNRPASCDPINHLPIGCLPKYGTREEVRSVNLLGLSYHSYLQGNLQALRSIHPEEEENTDPNSAKSNSEEICPFVEFRVDSKDIDFAEVGYQIRVTAEVSYMGTGIPYEADIIVEYERTMGVTIEITTSVREFRQLTIITKAIDINFHLADYLLSEMMYVDKYERQDKWASKLSYEATRAREKFSVLSITFRPSIINTLCRPNELFETVQYNVGCNAFSTVRLMSETTTLYKEDLNKKVGWMVVGTNLSIPRKQVNFKQVKGSLLEECSIEDEKCFIPYHDLFGDKIFIIHYRDEFIPNFEQMLTFTSRPVTGNVVIYDLLGSDAFSFSVNNYDAGCKNVGGLWYERLLSGTREIGGDNFVHENVYRYYKECFDVNVAGFNNTKEDNLVSTTYPLFNKTNHNTIRFEKNRNQIFVFRAEVVNTAYNRFTYCKYLDTFFMVRVSGVPIPRERLTWYVYLLVFATVIIILITTYFMFTKYAIWTVRQTTVEVEVVTE